MTNFKESNQSIRQTGAMKIYILIVLLFFGGFIWSEWNGFRLRGDDADSKELHGTPGSHRSHSRNHFYHK